jgi:hypothetical protein
MVVAEDLLQELETDSYEPVAAHMSLGDDVVTVINTIGAALTVVTTGVFSVGAFADILKRWLGRQDDPVRITYKHAGESVTLNLSPETARDAAPEIVELLAKLVSFRRRGPVQTGRAGAGRGHPASNR